jgi:alkylation response protein AidB-like acyl-CoA dehydrogenase
MEEQHAERCAVISDLVKDQAEAWDLEGELPLDLLRDLAARGLLCPQVPKSHGGLGCSSMATGDLTAHTGSLCSSLRSVMTSQGMAAWALQRLGHTPEHHAHLRDLTSGRLAAVGFTEPTAGSDLSAMRTTIRDDGQYRVVDGQKRWVTAAAYADLLVIIGRYGDGAAVALVPTSAPGVHLSRVDDPLGCRAAGHTHIDLDSVRLPAHQVLGSRGQSLALLVTTILAYGRISVAWGCVGILRACLVSAARHATSRQQFGKPLAEHQLIARHLTDLLAAEQASTRLCEHASKCWDTGSPETATATLLAKYVSARHAAHGAGTALQVLASAGARDGNVVARALRDAKLMEIIEGSNEICQLLLAQHVAAPFRDLLREAPCPTTPSL